MKVDEDQEVNDLFASSIRFDASPIDLSVKKFVYKLISDLKFKTKQAHPRFQSSKFGRNTSH
jgi:hypothetical protein